MNRFSIKVKDLIIYFIILALTVITYLLYLNGSSFTQGDLTAAAVLYTAAYVLGLYVIKRKTRTLNSLMTFFWTSFFLFHGSQAVMRVIGLGDFQGYDIFYFFQMEDIVQATHYSTICELFFAFGMMLNPVRQNETINRIKTDQYLSVLKNFGMAFIIAAVVPFVVYIVLILRAGVTVGYGAINDYSNYASSTIIKIIVIFVDFFVIGSFFMMIACYRNKLLYRAYIIVILGYSLVLLSLGERTEPSSLILLVFWLDNYLCTMSGNKAEARRKRIIAGVLLAVLVLVFPSIMALRHKGIISFSALIADIRANGVFESLKESIAGLGYSEMPLIEVRRLVASGEPLRYGTTYLAAVTNTVPFLGFAQEYASLSTWLMNRLHMAYGPGFSMAAEAYLNFMNVPFPLILYGFLISKILMWKKGDINLHKMIRGMIFIITCLTLPRRELSGRVRDIVYLVILLPIVINSFYRKKNQSDRRTVGQQAEHQLYEEYTS